MEHVKVEEKAGWVIVVVLAGEREVAGTGALGS
jgi:hypothetical protein